MHVRDMRFLRDYWYPVARTAGDGAPTPVRLFGDDFVLWRTAEGRAALSDPFCPHRSANLSGGWVDGDELVCPYHGWRFAPDGACNHVPQLSDHLPVPPRARLRTYPVTERYGLLWTCVGTPRTPGPPAWRESDEGGWRLHVEFFERWNVAAPRIIDNNLDQSHPAYVHQGTFGDPADARLPPYEVEPSVDGFVARIPQRQKGVGRQNGRTMDEDTRFERLIEVELLAPLTTRTRLHFGGNGSDYCFYGAATPVDDRSSIYVRLTALSGSEAEQPYDGFHAFGERVKEEDRLILETTDADFPLDLTSEVHLRCDRTTLEYRRHLARLAAPTHVHLCS